MGVSISGSGVPAGLNALEANGDAGAAEAAGEANGDDAEDANGDDGAAEAAGEANGDAAEDANGEVAAGFSDSVFSGAVCLKGL